MKPLIQGADEPVEFCCRDMPLLCGIWFDVVLGHGGNRGERRAREEGEEGCQDEE